MDSFRVTFAACSVSAMPRFILLACLIRYRYGSFDPHPCMRSGSRDTDSRSSCARRSVYQRPIRKERRELVSEPPSETDELRQRHKPVFVPRF